jgi:hypothetical protein
MRFMHQGPYFFNIGESLIFVVIERDDAVYIGMTLKERADAAVDDKMYFRFGKAQFKTVAKSHSQHGIAYAAEADD